MFENGKVTINYKPREVKPVREWLKSQGRFRHLFAPRNEHLIEEIQQDVTTRWENLLAREAAGKGQD